MLCCTKRLDIILLYKYFLPIIVKNTKAKTNIILKIQLKPYYYDNNDK